MKKSIILFFIIISLIRIIGLDNAVFFDEVLLIDSITDGSWINTDYHHRPPVTIFMLRLFTEILGFHIWAMRLMPLIFGILSIYLIYLVAKEIYDKKTGNIAAILMGFLFYPILSSLQINDDAILIFLYLFSTYFYLRYEKSKSILDYLLTGLGLGIILLTNYVGGLFFIILFIYSLIKEKSLIKTIKKQFFLWLISIATFSIFPIYYLIRNPETFWITILYIFEGVERIGIPLTGKLFALFMWATPLLIGLSILIFFKLKKKDMFMVVWFVLGFLLNLFIFRGGDFSRYFMFILPPLIILSARYLSYLRFNKKDKIFCVIGTVLFLILFLIINFNTTVKFPHLMSYYVNSIKQLGFNFILPYAISHGSWFGVSFIAVMVMLVITGLGFILFLFTKKKAFLLIFLIVGLSYNIFLDGEYLLHLSQPNYNNVIREMVGYVKENNLPMPYWGTDKGIVDMVYSYEKFPFNRGNIIHKYRIYEGNIDEVNNGTVLFLNFNQKIEREKIKCNLLKTFYSKGKEAGYVYECN